MNYSLKRLLSLSFSLFLTHSLFAQWGPFGNGIPGEPLQGQSSGSSISMPDPFTIAIGDPYNRNGGNWSQSQRRGSVRVFRLIGTSWVQKGGDLDGEAGGDRFGSSISMPDSNTLAIGAPENFGSGYRSGHVRVYRWTGSNWVQKGLDINGDTIGDLSGTAVSMPDSNTVAIGSVDAHAGGYRRGHVRIFEWNGSAWVQKGGDLNGEGNEDKYGYAVSMPDPNTVAIGGFFNDGNGTNAGHVRVFRWSGTNWVQKGSDLDGRHGSGPYCDWERFGYSVSMSDSNHLAVGGPGYSAAGCDRGAVAVFQWQGNSWTQKGTNILGDSLNDNFGRSQEMVNNDLLIAGTHFHRYPLGQVRIHAWNGTSWNQVGNSILGGSGVGWSVSMPDSSTFATLWSGANNGTVRVYRYGLPTSIFQESKERSFKIYPNPVYDQLILEQTKVGELMQFINLSGQVLLERTVTLSREQLDLSSFAEGIYFLKVGEKVQKVAVSR